VWLRRQEAKLLPVRYYMVTLTLPGVLRPVRKRQSRVDVSRFGIRRISIRHTPA